jgi:menaquinone-dependent protoporphyrinogen oxidase
LSERASGWLRAGGHTVATGDANLNATRLLPSDYDAAFLAASLYIGRYQAALVDYARRHHAALNAMPSAFISVSLSAAGVDRRDWDGLALCLARFQHVTMWRPKAVHQAAGAIRYRQYGLFTRFAIWLIARRRSQPTVLSHDYDFTDYGALKNFVLDFIGGGLSGTTPNSRRATDG